MELAAPVDVRTAWPALLLVGCTAKVIPAGPQSQDGWPFFASTTSYQLRRLTTEQFVSTARTLLGVSTVGMPPIEPVSPVGGYEAIGAAYAMVSSDGVAQFEGAANWLAQTALADANARQRLVPCTPSGVADTACFSAFVTSFGPRVFRRPLSTDEISAYVGLTGQVAASTGDPWGGLQSTLSAFLQSPNFLYLPEVGEPDPSRPGGLRYTNDEMASRLSFFLTHAGPDDALLAAAAAGELTNPEGIQTQVQRLLGQAGARTAVRSFFSAMLALDGLDSLSRPVAQFPSFTPTLGPALKEQTLLTFEDLVFDRDADYRSVFQDTQTFVNPELATFYGVPAPAGAGFSRVALPDGTRVGLLGQAGVLVVHDHSNATSPTKRGLFVLTRLLCQSLALAPPANLTIPPPPTGVMTARQRLTEHASNAVCASCHGAMDPVGLSLEHFDAIGAYRPLDQGMAIDDSGAIKGVTYQGEPGLSALLAQHPALEPCLVQAIYGTSVGHAPDEFDRDTFTSLVSQFDASGARIRSLLVAITTSDGFRYLPVPN
jgi:hypothetical protein